MAKAAVARRLHLLDHSAAAERHRPVSRRPCAAAPAEVARLAVPVDTQQDKVFVQTFGAVDADGCRQPVDELRIEDARRFVVDHWRLALAAWRAGRRDAFWSLEPLHLRPSSAEIKHPG